jgi:hypothetical protein
LLKQLSDLCAGVLYERFGNARKAAVVLPDADKWSPISPTLHYDRFVAEMKAGGVRRVFEDKPVLLRLIATITRQWIDTTLRIVDLDNVYRPVRQQSYRLVRPRERSAAFWQHRRMPFGDMWSRARAKARSPRLDPGIFHHSPHGAWYFSGPKPPGLTFSSEPVRGTASPSDEADDS